MAGHPMLEPESQGQQFPVELMAEVPKVPVVVAESWLSEKGRISQLNNTCC